MASIVVPRFEMTGGIRNFLTRDSWEEIFSSLEPQGSQNHHLKFYRKLRTVRIATKDALYFSLCGIRGLYDNPKYPYRRVYGQVLFHIRHDRDRTIPYQCQTQLTVAFTGAVYSGEVSSVTAYIVPKTRFSEMVYRQEKNGTYTPVGNMDITDQDYNHGLLRTNKMVCEWNYSPPPLRE